MVRRGYWRLDEVRSVKGLELVEVGDVVLGLGGVRCAVTRSFDN